jgi:hypothetical protein
MKENWLALLQLRRSMSHEKGLLISLDKRGVLVKGSPSGAFATVQHYLHDSPLKTLAQLRDKAVMLHTHRLAS